MRKLLLVFCGAGALAFGAVPAGAILHGQPDGNAHPYVGMVTDLNFVCSGSAVSARKFITAAHCFETGPGTPVLVTFDQEGFDDFPVGFVSGKWYPHPQWCNVCGNGLPGFDRNDVAVVILDAPIGLSEYAKLPSLGQARALRMKQPISLVGYGVQDRLKDLDPGELFTRFFAPAQLIQSSDVIAADFLKLTANPAQGKGGICFGDSGGPVLLEGAGRGNDVVLGVNSFVTNVNCAGVTYSNRLDIPATLNFVNSVN